MKYLSLITILFLGGCAHLSPVYEKPLNIGENNSSFVSENKTYTSYKWWEEYHSENINDLMNIMFNENQDLLSYKKELELSIKNYELDNSSLFPTVDLKDEMILGKNTIKTNKFGLNINSYEIDYLGKIKEKLKMSSADIKITDANFESFKTIASYNVVSNYIYCGNANTQINITQKKIDNLNKMKSILEKNVEIGIKPYNMLLDLETEVNAEVKTLYVLKIAKNDAEKILKSVIGRDVDIEYKSLSETDINENMIASEQINKRFDIQAAEQSLIIQNAKIGLIKSQYFPTLSLSSFLGVKTNGDLFGSTTSFWSVSPSLVVNVFDYGNISLQIEKQKLEKEKSLYNYVKTVRMAFLEVKTNVLNYKEKKEEFGLAKETLLLSEKKNDIIKKKFEIGLVSEYDVLVSENLFLSTKLNFEKLKSEKEMSLLNLRKSLQGKVN